MAKKPKRRSGAARKPGAQDEVASARVAKKPKGLAAVGFLAGHADLPQAVRRIIAAFPDRSRATRGRPWRRPRP